MISFHSNQRVNNCSPLKTIYSINPFPVMFNKRNNDYEPFPEQKIGLHTKKIMLYLMGYEGYQLSWRVESWWKSQFWEILELAGGNVRHCWKCFIDQSKGVLLLHGNTRLDTLRKKNKKKTWALNKKIYPICPIFLSLHCSLIDWF